MTLALLVMTLAQTATEARAALWTYILLDDTVVGAKEICGKRVPTAQRTAQQASVTEHLPDHTCVPQRARPDCRWWWGAPSHVLSQ
jgi:hypothetical protein